MKRLLVICAVVITVTGTALPVASAMPRPPDIDSVTVWNNLALDAVRLTRASDSDAARSYAMVNAAIYDAVNGLAARHGHRVRAQLLDPPGTAPPRGDRQAAAVGAAHAVLTRLYPAQSARFDDQLAADLTRLGDGPRVASGRGWGQAVGTYIADARAADGSRPVESQPAGSGPGVFPLAWSGVQYAAMAPFAITDPGRYVSPGPPALSSPAYASAFNEVKRLGDLRIADPAKTALFQYWSLPAGSVQPPGEWVKIALEIAGTHHIPLADKARLLALLGVALSDTTIPTTRTKAVFRHWRPETAIQQADTDGNPLTDKDENWKARAGSPGAHPSTSPGTARSARPLPPSWTATSAPTASRSLTCRTARP